jgi:hypothetical protein
MKRSSVKVEETGQVLPGWHAWRLEICDISAHTHNINAVCVRKMAGIT